MWFWAYPVCLWVGHLASHIYQAVHFRSSASTPQSARSSRSTRSLFTLHVILCISLIGTVVLTAAVQNKFGYHKGWLAKDYLSSTLGVCLFYLAGLLPDPDEPYSVSDVNLHMWLISLVFEVTILSITWSTGSVAIAPSASAAVAQSVFSASRILVMLSEIAIYLASTKWATRQRAPEEESLLGDQGSGELVRDSDKNGLESKTFRRSGDAQTTTWLDYLLGFSRLFPFLWPSDSRVLQLRAIFCFILLILQRVVNILVPHQLGLLVYRLGPGQIPHKEILLYILFRGLQGQQGVIGSFRAILWIPISQSTYRRLSSATFEHVLRLSLDFHLSKRIGEVMSALSKGGALNTFLDGFAFQLFPMVIDLWIAAAYFFFVFDALYALTVIAVTWLYIFVTIYMAKYRGRARREMIRREREMEAAKTDALLSYETVHHSGAVPTEVLKYSSLIAHFQKAEYNVFFSLNLLNAVQNGVFTVGTLLVVYLDAYQISINMQKVAMFVTLLTYLAQLQAPLNFFGSFYTQVQNNLVDAERMLELYDEKQSVADSDNAAELEACQGRITFSNISFAYGTGRLALRNISFDILPGKTVAIVGQSGSGKSTLLKLLFRFYDADRGAIKVDGQDIRNLRMESLRDKIAVVPQDTVLFNDTLMYNLLYARPDATDEEVYQACRSASIHDKIIGFPSGYMTKVGERGMKLSGGERQRIAIARAFLKRPRILLLDEATSSLDSETERQIQTSLEKVSEGRTTVAIAHRLSTITKADEIIVLEEGRVVEQGNHAELLALNKVYAEMWRKQTETTNTP